MSWFKKKQPAVQSPVGIANAIEIIAHKEAKDEVVKEARAVNKQLNDLLVENGFSIKIYIAAGGNHPTKKGSQ